jgi:diadenylate cyclase
MHYLAIIEHLRFRDILDVLFLTVVVYHLYIWFRGTKALKALIGLAALGIIYTAARFWGLFLTTWVFQILWQVLVIMLIILFQSEIRQVLERVNPLQVIGLHPYSKSTGWIPAFVEGIFNMAKRRIGALVIIERLDRVREWVTAGFPLSADPGPELLLSLFQKESPLHDGAALIRGDRLVLAACYLPLSSAEGLPKEWGTRHRAAMGLSERCDAWVVVVSEERGVVSLAKDGRMTHVESPEHLRRLMEEAAAPPTPKYGSWRERFKALVTTRWPIKVGTLALVSIVWLLLAGQQNFQITLRVPLEVKDLPPQVEVVQPLNPEVKVTVQGLRKDVGTLNERNVHAEIHLSDVREGTRTYFITPEQISLPDGQLHIVEIEPQRLQFTFKRKTKEGAGG